MERGGKTNTNEIGESAWEKIKKAERKWMKIKTDYIIIHILFWPQVLIEGSQIDKYINIFNYELEILLKTTINDTNVPLRPNS